MQNLIDFVDKVEYQFEGKVFEEIDTDEDKEEEDD
jgi:hypothetical protein